MRIKFKAHSLIDVITNSSTEIFISAHGKTVDYVKDLINQILKIAKSEKTVDDLFNIYTEPDKDEVIQDIEEWFWYMDEDTIEVLKSQGIETKGRNRSESVYAYWEKNKNIHEGFASSVDRYWGVKTLDELLTECTQYVIIESKEDSKEMVGLQGMLMSMFDIYERSN